MQELYQIKLSYACAGIIVQNNTVIRTAPIFSWMTGKNLNQIKTWVYNKKGTIYKIS